MSDSSVQLITSRENALIQRLRRLSQEPLAYRKQGEVWLEGDHLCSAAVARGVPVPVAVVTDSVWLGEHGSGDRTDPRADLATRLARRAARVVVVPAALWKVFTGLESPAGIGYLLPVAGDAPLVRQPHAGLTSVVLDRLQDAGNVGSIVRSAAALGFAQVLALKGTAALWSPKVVRAGMGAHFGLHLAEGLDESVLDALKVPLLVTSSHQGQWLHKAELPWPCAWVMGHEGQGVGDALMARASAHVRIIQPGGEESLNVAAAAAICLHASAAQRAE